MGFDCPYKEAEKGEALQLGEGGGVKFSLSSSLSSDVFAHQDQGDALSVVVEVVVAHLVSKHKGGLGDVRREEIAVWWRRIFLSCVHLSISVFEPDQLFLPFLFVYTLRLNLINFFSFLCVYTLCFCV